MYKALDTSGCSLETQADYRKLVDSAALKAGVVDAVNILWTAAGLWLAPATFGIGTVALWGVGWVAGKAMDFALGAQIDAAKRAVADTVAFCRREGRQDLTDDLRPIADPVWIYDPSGYVFEAVPSNRLSGVTATVHQKDEVAGTWAAWDAAWFGQDNPQVTGADGRYAWDVPAGLWQVVYEKDGYEQARSAELRVLPPHLDVNVGLVSYATPDVASVSAEDGGPVEVVFDRYMRPETVTDALTVQRGTDALPGAVTGVDAEQAPDGTTYARTFRFTPDAPLAQGQVLRVSVGELAQSYAGRPLGAVAVPRADRHRRGDRSRGAGGRHRRGRGRDRRRPLGPARRRRGPPGHRVRRHHRAGHPGAHGGRRRPRARRGRAGQRHGVPLHGGRGERQGRRPRRDVGARHPERPTAPAAPASVTAVGGNAAATVTWTPPADDGGTPVTGWVLTSTPATPERLLPAETTSVSVGGLANGTAYRFTVAARNAPRRRPRHDVRRRHPGGAPVRTPVRTPVPARVLAPARPAARRRGGGRHGALGRPRHRRPAAGRLGDHAQRRRRPHRGHGTPCSRRPSGLRGLRGELVRDGASRHGRVPRSCWRCGSTGPAARPDRRGRRAPRRRPAAALHGAGARPDPCLASTETDASELVLTVPQQPRRALWSLATRGVRVPRGSGAGRARSRTWSRAAPTRRASRARRGGGCSRAAAPTGSSRRRR
jgi:hypothetical protein